MKDSLTRLMQLGKQLEKVSNHNMSGIEEKNSDEVLVVGVIFMKNGDLPMDQLEDIIEKEQVNPSRVSLSLPYEEIHLNWLEVQAQNNQRVEHYDNVLIETLEGARLIIERLEPSLDTQIRIVNQIRHQKRTSIDDINTSFNPINLDHIFEDVDPLSEWLQEKENPLLDGEIAGVLHVDTSDDETNIDESQQQNLAHSSSSATPSQSRDGLDGGGLSPIDDDDDDGGGGGDGRDEIRYSSLYEREYGVGTTSGYFRDRSKFGGNISSKAIRNKSEPKAPSKGKCKKHTSVGSSSSRRSSSSNLGQGDSSTSTQGFYPPEQFLYFQPLHGYPQPYGYYPSFSNYGVPYQPQMYPPPPIYQPPPLLMYPPQIYPPHQLYENQGENVTFFLDMFLDKGHENQVKKALKMKVNDMNFLVIPLIGEN
ncbi:hypothetical protein F3Y22_tig00110621pilonHSYRG00538 [Hibiscus syriacus]|uniref:Uncharacterized protein n=1 Tax=Hibiscus syriacus TaxID=106335 RepID=A0A6A2ZZX7_HIBSY|nr:hypothetical protein F3Y22_tig00110621pilonHSYRG00538 [Hibiscus syriacus]